MTEYAVVSTTEKKAERIFCNQCGREISKNALGYFQDHVHVEKEWGYFSGKDGTRYSFDLCEECFNHMVEGFAIKPEQI